MRHSPRGKTVKNPRHLKRLLALSAAIGAALAPVMATRPASADEYWDPGHTATPNGSGGAGTWDTATANWVPVGGTADTTYDGSNAIFDTTGGAVTLGQPITAAGLTFNVGGYTIANGGTPANSLTLGGTPFINQTNAAVTGTNTISAQLIGSAAVTANVSAGTLALTNTSTTAANSFTAGSVFNVSNGGRLVASAATGGNALGTASVALSGTGSTFQVAPSIAATTAGITARYYNLASSPTGLQLVGLQNPGATPVTFTAAGSTLNPNVSFNGTSGIAPTLSRTENTTTGTPINYSTQGAGPNVFVTGVTSTNFAASWTGMVNLPTGGLYTFDTNSDDASALYVNGLAASNVVVDNNGGHGDYEHQGTVALGAGLHQITVLYDQGTGGDNIQVKYITPGGNLTLIPASAYVQSSTNETGVNLATPVSVSGTQTLDLGSAQGSAIMGALTLTGGSTLNTTGSGLTSGNGGSFRFTSTTVNAGTSASVTFNATTADVIPGAVSVGTGVTGVTYHKTGAGALILDNSATGAGANNFGAAAVFDVQTGTLAALGAVGGGINGSTTVAGNPLGTATVQLNGTNVLLQLGTQGAYTAFGFSGTSLNEFDNNIVVNQSATIDAMPAGVTNTANPNTQTGPRIRLGNFTGNPNNASPQTLTVASGKTLTLNLLNNSAAGGQNVLANYDVPEFEISANVSSSGAASLSTNVATSATAAGRFYLDGNNASYTGTWTLNSAAAFVQIYDAGTSNTLGELGTTSNGVTPLVQLNAGTLEIKANGTASNSTPTFGTTATPVNVSLTGSGTGATINVDRSSSATITGDTIRFGNLAIGAQTLTVAGGDSYALQFVGATTLSGNATFKPGSANLTLGNVGTDATTTRSLTMSGTGTLYLTGTSTYAGGTTVASGTLAGTTNSLQGNIASNGAVIFDQTLNSGGALASGTYSGNLTGSGTVAKNNAGTVTLAGTNSYAGGMTISAGTVIGTTNSLTNNITNNATLVFDQTVNSGGALASGTYAGVIGGSGAVVKQGAGTVILSGTATYAGSTTVTGGTLALGNPVTQGAAAYYSFNSGTVSGTTVTNLGAAGTGKNGTLQNLATTTTGGIFGNALSISTASNSTQFMSIALTAVNGASKGVNLAGGSYTLSAWYNTLNTNVQYRTLFRGNINDHQILLNNAAGNQLGTYNNAGPTNYNPVTSGGSNVSLPADTGVWHMLTEVGSPGSSTTSYYLDGAPIGTAAYKSLTDIYAVGNYQGGSQAFASRIDEVYLYQRALAAGDISSLYNYTLSGNTTAPAVTNVIPATTSLLMGAGTLDLAGSAQTVASLADTGPGGGVITNSSTGAAAFTINLTSGTAAFGGSIQNGSGTTGLNKTGGGTQVLSGASTYTGPTSITAGTLRVSGSLGGTTVTVNGGTLAGTGTLAGPAVAVTGTIAPGAGTAAGPVGNLTIASLTLASASTLSIVLDPANSQGNGTTSQVTTAGPANLDSDGGAGSNLTVALLSAPTTGQKFTIIDDAGSSAIAGTFAQGSTVTGTFGGNTYTFTVNYADNTDAGATANDVTLTASAVPEPASFGLAGLGALGLLARRRRLAR